MTPVHKAKRCLLLRLVLLVLLGSSVFGLAGGAVAARSGADTILDAQTLLRDVLERVRLFYITPVETAGLMQTGLESMLASLDAESSYLPPGTPPLKNTGSLGDIPELGLIVTYADGMLVVVSPTDYGPAKDAGIRPKDRLYALGRTPLMVTSLFDGVRQLRQALSDLAANKAVPETQYLTSSPNKATPGGKSLSFIVQHANQTIETIAITPDFAAGAASAAGKESGPAVTVSVQNPNEADGKKGKIVVIRLARLPSDTAKQVEDKVAALGQNFAGAILDLRRLAGGDFEAALATANLFVESGVLAKVKRREEAKNDSDKTDKTDKTANNKNVTNIMAESKRHSKILARPLPVVVLIDEGTADAAESLAAALQGNKRAVLVGGKSFGRATLRSQVALSNGGKLILATGRYLTPDGSVIEKTGLTPDIVISNLPPLGDKDAPSGPNPANKKAKKPVKDATKPAANNDANNMAAADDKPRDPQMERALDIVTGMALYRGQAG